MIIYN